MPPHSSTRKKAIKHPLFPFALTHLVHSLHIHTRVFDEKIDDGNMAVASGPVERGLTILQTVQRRAQLRITWVARPLRVHVCNMRAPDLALCVGIHARISEEETCDGDVTIVRCKVKRGAVLMMGHGEGPEVWGYGAHATAPATHPRTTVREVTSAPAAMSSRTASTCPF